MPDAEGALARNRALWTTVNAQVTDDAADRTWAAEELIWGLFGVPERDLDVLGAVAGLDVIELGCGTAYLSAQLPSWVPTRSASTSRRRSLPLRPPARSASGWRSP